ncbi:Uncharacterized protein APZ42_015009 [Daphnia magna]|uniref:Uncharacterized protein n=1 Tax=Daphnia magna TaxID=35525 RepID=A0A162P3H7_9CRUS|nr:Uncharacterized protein APZ42_015009 [Daphnia magna]
MCYSLKCVLRYGCKEKTHASRANPFPLRPLKRRAATEWRVAVVSFALVVKERTHARMHNNNKPAS